MKWGWLHRISGCVLLATLGACQSPTNIPFAQAMVKGEYGQARNQMASTMTTKHGDRNYMLDRLRLAIAALADGVPQAADRPLDEVYTILRTQGINEHKALESAVLNEDLKTWKGEPFEQAMALHYISLHHMIDGQWGNARAASSNSLFQLRDFGADAEDGQRLDQEEIVRRAAKDKKEDYLAKGYVETNTNFTLGYLMHGLANQNLGRTDEAADNYQKALQINPALRDLVDQLQNGRYNTLLVVDFGPGPQKIGTGPDKAIAKFQPLVASDQRPLSVRAGTTTHTFPVACDLNMMAQDHMWNNLEDMRLAKSHIGSALLAGGAATTAVGASYRSEGAMYAGLGMMLAGAIAKAGAHADERFCEAMPQRVYLVPISVDPQSEPIELGVDSNGVSPGARMVLHGLSAPHDGTIQVRYVRFVAPGIPALWADQTSLVYCTDVTGCLSHAPDSRPHLPFILGGYCARTPTAETLSAYQRAGLLQDFTLDQVNDLFRLEGLEIVSDDPAAEPGLHALEGGRWVYTPLAGTAGFSRLYAQSRQPYRPQSPEVGALAQQFETMPATASGTVVSAATAQPRE